MNLLDFKSLLAQAALKAAKQTKDGRDGEIGNLRLEIQVVYVINSNFCYPFYFTNMLE